MGIIQPTTRPVKCPTTDDVGEVGRFERESRSGDWLAVDTGHREGSPTKPQSFNSAL